VLTSPYTDANGNAVIDMEVSWVLSATPATGNVIVGYWIDYEYPVGSGTKRVLLWEPLPNLPMNANGDAIVLVIPFALPSQLGATVL
jgi:hypothetical protein